VGFSAQEEYISATARQTRQTYAPILECGSGLSSLFLAVETGRRNLAVWSLEQASGWQSESVANLEVGISGQ
jgi:hypothetical protein